ncbi:hypothetical protein BJ166DRAFT_517026 [Pestalotiopsis sp. NC0098]|nr:hypothetical protein BJ166DRAFT_517026 [Pestalotiopsis sp. NC0098]
MKIFKASCSERAQESYERALLETQKITEDVPSQMIRIPDRTEWMESANGKHICFVLSLHGPKITHHDLEEPAEMTQYLQRVLLCLRALNMADIGHGGIHPGNILYDVDDSVYQYSEEQMLKCLGQPTRHKIEAAESSGKEFARAHAPRYLTAPTQGLGRLKLLSSIALTDVTIAIELNDKLRNKHMSKQQKTNADLWGFCFTTMRMGQRKKLNALPWQPITKRRNPETHKERLDNLMAHVFQICNDILHKMDLNEKFSFSQKHGVDPASIESLNKNAALNLVLQGGVEHLFGDPNDLWLFGDLIDETRNFRIRDPPLFKGGSEDDDTEEEVEDPDTQVKPGETANEYNTLTGSVKPLAQSPFRGDRALSRFRDGEVQGKTGPTKSTKKSVQPEKKSEGKSEEKKSEEKKSKEKKPEEKKPEEKKPEEKKPVEKKSAEKKPEEKNVVKSKEKSKEKPDVKSKGKAVEKPQQKSKESSTPKSKERSKEKTEEKAGEKSQQKSKEKSKENPKGGEKKPKEKRSKERKPEEDEEDEIRTVPVYQKSEEQEESASSAQSEARSSTQSEPEVQPEPESKPDPEPEEEQELEHEKTPEPESRPRDKSPKVRREAFQYVVLGLIVMFAFLTVVFATLFFWARPSPAVAGPALKNAGELLYMQSRRLSPQTTFFEGVLTSSGAEGSTREADARALFQGLGFLESEFKTLSE